MDTIGRKDKLFELQKAWAVALSGRPRVAFVDGRAGVGKSHLVDGFFEMIGDQQTTDKRPLIGVGRCAELDQAGEALRPAWDGLAELLAVLGRQNNRYDPVELSTISDLSAVIPDTHLDAVGPALGRLVSDESGHLGIPRQTYLGTPEILIRHSLLSLSARQPVALFIDNLERADAATLTLLANLVDVLWEQDQPFYFLLVLAYRPALATSRGMVAGLEERLRRHDRPDNRIITRVHLDGLDRHGVAELVEQTLIEQTLVERRTRQFGDRAGSCGPVDPALVDWLVDTTAGRPRPLRNLVAGLDAHQLIDASADAAEASTDTDSPKHLVRRIEHGLAHWGDGVDRQAAGALVATLTDKSRRLMGIASLLGRRFSAATVASVVGADPIEVAADFQEMVDRDLLRQTHGPTYLDRLGHPVFEFKTPTMVDGLRSTMAGSQRRQIHSRIANELLVERGRLRDGRQRLAGAEMPSAPAAHAGSGGVDFAEKFAQDATQLGAAVGRLHRPLLAHLSHAGRPVEAAGFLAHLADDLGREIAEIAGDTFGVAEQARQAFWLARLAEKNRMALAKTQPQADPVNIVEATYDTALAAAKCRLQMGCYHTSLRLLADAIDAAGWLDDRPGLIDAQCRKLEVLYRAGQHRRARKLFEAMLDSSAADATTDSLCEIMDIFQTYEHSAVAIDRLQDLAATLDQYGRTDAVGDAYRLILETHAERLFDRWDIGELGHDDLADVTRKAQRRGFEEQWLAILLAKFDTYVRAERIRHAWFHLQSRQPLGLIRAAIELLERSRRLTEVVELTVSSARQANDPDAVDRIQIDFAEVYGLWRDRADFILAAWTPQSAQNAPAADASPIDQLQQAVRRGPLRPQAYLSALDNGMTAADRQQARRASLALRNRRIGQSSEDSNARRILAELDERADQASRPGLDLYRRCAELHMLAGNHDRHDQRLRQLGEQAEAAAATCYARADQSDRVWLADIGAQMADISGRPADRDAWFNHQIQAVGRADDAPRSAPIAPVDLAEAALWSAGQAGHEPAIRTQWQQACEARDDAEFEAAVDHLRQAQRRLPDQPACWPAAHLIADEHAQLCQADDDPRAALGGLDRAVELARRLGQYDALVGSLIRAAQLAYSLGTDDVAGRCQTLMDTASELGSIDLLDRTFDTCFELLERIQQQSPLDASAQLALEDAVEAFVDAQVAELRRLGATGLVRKWDAIVARTIDTTRTIEV